MKKELLHIFDQIQGNILFAGVGNVLKHDDGVGVFIASRIRTGKFSDTLVVEMGIENYIGKINRMAPDGLIIIDACDFGREPGFWSIKPVSVITGMTTSTHNISLAKISELFNMPVYILGIQPADISFGEGLGEEAGKAARQIIDIINSMDHKPIIFNQ